jgi:hypothetical protein
VLIWKTRLDDSESFEVHINDGISPQKSRFLLLLHPVLHQASISLSYQAPESLFVPYYYRSFSKLMMRYSLFALGAGQMAMAMFANTTEPASSNSMPDTVGDYQLVGCSSSANGFPGMVKVVSSEDMNLDLCGASCQAKFMAVDGP